MLNIGFNPQRNIKPAFGCEDCESSKKILTAAGVPESRADAYVKDSFSPSEKPEDHLKNAAALKEALSKKGQLAPIVNMLKNVRANR
ncbi:MAG: hypothetical protein WCG23_00650 [bacterium]